MKKFLIVVMVLTLALTGCETRKISFDDGERVILDKFVVLEKIYDPDYGNLYTTYDKETKVEYYIYSSGYRSSMCPIYNANGTLKLYEGEVK